MDNEPTLVELPQPSIASEAGRAFVVSIASTAGLFGGMAVVGWIITAWQHRKKQPEPTIDPEPTETV